MRANTPYVRENALATRGRSDQRPRMVDQEFTTKAMRKVSGNGQELTVFAVSTSAVDYFMEFHGVVMLKLP